MLPAKIPRRKVHVNISTNNGKTVNRLVANLNENIVAYSSSKLHGFTANSTHQVVFGPPGCGVN